MAVHNTLLASAAEHDSVDDDAVLVRAALADPTGFAPLYRRYRDRVYWYIRARAAGDDDATDLTQHVFLRALDALPQYRPANGPFAGWLFRIARNAVIDHYRRTHATVTWDLVPLALQPMAAHHDPLASALRRESLERLRALVAALDVEKRELLVLRFAAGLTAPEIATVVGKSEAATKKMLARTIQTLKERYHDDAR